MTDPTRDRLPRLRAGVGAIVVLALLGLGVAVLLSVLAPGGRSEMIEPAPGDSAVPDGGSGAARDAAVFVHILGAVHRPGLYELHEGDRAVDAVAAAGGFTPEADQSALNLARVVVDGEQLVVPVVGAAPPAGVPPAAPTDGRVNLNTADPAELETLPRVGPELAQRIVDWRESNGPFRSVDDLGQVSGIGEKTLEGLRDAVTV